MPSCLLVCLLLEEPLSELLALSLQSALTLQVLAQQAWERHLTITLVCFSAAVLVVRVKLIVVPRLLMQLSVDHQGLFSSMLLLHLSCMQNAS